MEELIPTIYEEGEERIDTVQEGTIIAGVQTINGKAGDLDLKTINGQDILTAGDLSLATTEQLATKQDALTETQLEAVNSGIDADKVQQIADNTTAIAGKQDQLTQTQLNAVNSGIDETKVQQIATNASNITSLQTGKQDKLIAGTNIQIASDGKTISATDTKYTAGTGLTLVGTQFSVTEPVPSGFFTDTAPIAEGEGTAITLSNTADAPIDNVELKGDTYQFTTTGKNLADIIQTAQENNGITSTRNGGEVTLTGTATATSVCQLTAYFTCKAGNTYTISANNPVANSNVLLRLYRSGGSTRAVVLSSVNASESTTFTENESVRLEVRVASGTAFSSAFSFKPMLELGSTPTPYEPYTAGASPNPDYPQQIDTVTGEQTVSVVGKNLLNPVGLDQNVFSGTINNTYYYNADLNYTIEAGKTYTLSVQVDAVSVTPYQFLVLLGDATPRGGVATVTSLTTIGGRVQATFTPTQANIDSYGNRLFMRVPRYNTPTTATYSLSNIQLEYGDSMTSYQPYQSQTYKVNLGKNLWDEANPYKTGYAIDASGVEGANANFNIYGNIQVPANTTLTVSAKGATTSTVVRMHAYSLAGAWEQQLFALTLPINTEASYTFTTPDHPCLLRWNGYITISNRQLELGLQKTTYSAYFTPIELCKIGTYQDYIWKDGADWKVHKAIGKVVLDGTESWSGINSNACFFTGVADAYILGQNIVADMRSDYYTPATYYNLYSSSVPYGVAAHNSQARILIRNKDCADSTAFKTWLQSHNTTVYYPFATPTDTTITDANLIAQLEALASSTTYAPQTNYTTSTPSPNLPTILTIDVFKNNYAGLLARLNKAGA